MRPSNAVLRSAQVSPRQGGTRGAFEAEGAGVRLGLYWKDPLTPQLLCRRLAVSILDQPRKEKGEVQAAEVVGNSEED